MTMDRKDSNIGGFFQPFDQEYRTGGSFSLIHPLMQGSGTAVNLASVRIAYNNTRISELDLRQITLDTLSLAHQAYWALVFSRINLAINQQSLGLAADLLRENRIRFKYGDLIAVDVFEAEAGVKQRERDVIAAENDLQNSMDGIRELVALDRKQPDWQAPLIPLDPPVFTPIVVDEPLSQDVAMKKNPQIQAARFDIQNAQEGLLLAQDRFRPSLDAVASLSESGLGETLHEDHDELMSGDYPSGSIALQYEMPLYRRKERAGILSSNYQIAQAQFNLRSIEQQVIYDHRQAVRNVENLERQVEASRASVRAERDRLEKQKIGHEQGVTTSHDLLEVQDAFAKAQASEIRAIVDYYLALIELERIRGTLVDSLGVQLVPMATVK
jgi:outer membrane protein TolC